jgi:NADH-quinone oxidoreductase subunit J
MLTRAPIGREVRLTGSNWPVGIAVAVAIAGMLGYALIDAFGNDKLPEGSHQLTADVSDSIFSTYLVPFEVVSVLLLAALVGAIVLARKE